MFRIYLGFTEFDLTGLAALDERRRLKLPDASSLKARDTTTPQTEVSEGFARLHFERKDVSQTRTVTFDMLTPADVITQDNSRYGAHVALNPDMPPDRVRELFLAGKR